MGLLDPGVLQGLQVNRVDQGRRVHLPQVLPLIVVCSVSSLLTSTLCRVVCFTGLFSVGEKGEMGLPGPPGHCECDSKVANNAPFGSYTNRSPFDKVPAVRPRRDETILNL